MNSILTYIKKMIGITEEYEHFDVDIISHINSTFVTLNQLGVGPVTGFSIEDKTAVWSDFIPEDHWFFPWIKTYVYSKVRLSFDPPTNSAHLTSLKETIAELEYRIIIAVDSDPNDAFSDYKLDYTKLSNLPSINGESLVGNYDEKDPTVKPINSSDVESIWNKAFKE